MQVFHISEQEVRHLSKNPFHVSYPRHWFAPIALSPFARTIEEETIHWMTSLGLVPSVRDLAHIRSMEPRHYAGYSHSMASYDHALAYCKYITVWLLWDDQRVEVATDCSQVELPLRALGGETLDPVLESSDPYIAAFRHIGDEYERMGASRRWRVRFSEKMVEWAKNAIEEEGIRRRGDENQSSREFSEALKLRAITVGIRPNTLPLERATGFEIPDGLNTDPDFKKVIDHAALICCIVNDLVGVPKDIRYNQRKSNLVLYHMTYFNCSLENSIKAILRIHDDAVDAYDQLTAKILAQLDPTMVERVRSFFNNLRYMDSGFGFWHRDCFRYQQYMVFEENRVLSFSIAEREGVTLPTLATS